VLSSVSNITAPSSTSQISGHSIATKLNLAPFNTFSQIENRINSKERVISVSMGKKGGAKKLPKSESKFQNPITLREEATGKLKTKPIVNIKSHLRIDHLKKLAVWATTDPHIPSLSAFYGQHLATVSEAAGVPPDPSLITCQRFVFLSFSFFFWFFYA
jgi:hypothetical protein